MFSKKSQYAQLCYNIKAKLNPNTFKTTSIGVTFSLSVTIWQNMLKFVPLFCDLASDLSRKRGVGGHPFRQTHNFTKLGHHRQCLSFTI
eukprot:SAG31_NODE_1355_length_8661_cov_3.130343_2_plen_89_part_00